MAKRNEVVYQLAQDWLIWLNSRRFLGDPPQKNILAAMMERNKMRKDAPNGPMSAEIAAFNLAVNALNAGQLIPFIAVYCDFRPKPIKTMADELGIQSPAFYERAHDVASKVYGQAMQLAELNKQMRREIEDYID